MTDNPTPTTRIGNLKRRDFIKRSAAFGSVMVLPSYIALGKNGTGPNSKLNVAGVGVGGKGSSDIRSCDTENIVALCDVDERRASGTFNHFKDAAKFADYRVMLDKMDNEIDAVTVSTPDFMHFPVAMAAMARGKHVFVQKPLAHTVWEARHMQDMAKRQGVVTQMGIQGHTKEGQRLLREWIEADAIGDVREIVYWTNRPIWPQGPDVKTPTQQPPAHIDWDLWQGVSMPRPYSPAYAPFAWRGFWDYGCGAMGDIGCHAMDAGFWALQLGAPTSVEAETTPFTSEICPQSSTIVFNFPARGDKPPVKVTWMDGGRMPEKPKELDQDRELNPEWGQLFIGDKGKIYANDAYCVSPRIIPEEKMREFMREKRPEKKYPRVNTGPQQEWIRAIKGEGPAPGANFDYSGPLTEMVLLGNVAILGGQKIEWDSDNFAIKNAPELNHLLTKEYRPGYQFQV